MRGIRRVGPRLVHLVLVVLAVGFMTSLLISLIPGDPALAILGESATPEQIAIVNERLGTDQSIVARYFDWLGGVLTGDLGSSLRTGESIAGAIGARLPVTLTLAFSALALALLVAIPAGILSAHFAGRRFDRMTNLASSALISAPAFLVAIVLLFLFAVTWQVFPVTGWVPMTENPAEAVRHLVLPVVSLAAAEIAMFLRLLRSDMIQTLQQDFVLAARATGLPTRRILLQYALRPSSFSLVTLAGISLGRLLGGTVIVEVLFSLPGLGQYMVASIFNKDFLAVQATVLLVAVGYVVVNTLVDFSYQWLDPRVKARGAA